MTFEKPFIDLYSDTKSLPTEGIRYAIYTAAGGDEQTDEDPTVLALRRRVADLMGKEAAVLLPSGTMANEIVLQVHCRTANEVICDETAHIVTVEGGGPAANASVMLHQLDSKDGIYNPEQLEQALNRPDVRYKPRKRLVWVE